MENLEGSMCFLDGDLYVHGQIVVLINLCTAQKFQQ